MKRYQLISISLVALIIFVIACQRQLFDKTPDPGPRSGQPDKMVTSSFQGQVLDEHDTPVKDVMVTAGGKTARTDEHGVFRFENIPTSQQFAYIKVEREGYFPGSRTVIAEEGGSNFVRIKLLPATLRGKFESSEAAWIDVAGEASVSFTANSVIRKDGGSYSGRVHVFAAVLDPTAEDFGSIMPGSLRGVRANNSIAAMISYGMLAVALRGDAGEELQLDPSKPATISMDVPASLRASAPADIPLWHFDESDGKWKEEGVALKKGNKYSGVVKHFSYWNFDVPQDFVFVTVDVKSDKNFLLPYQPVKIIDKDNGAWGTAYADSTGLLRTWVPKKSPLELQVIGICGDILLTRNIGPLAEDAVLESLVVPSGEMIAIVGRVVNCEGEPVVEGHVDISIGGLNYRSEITDGKFSAWVNKCGSTPRMARIWAVEKNSPSSNDFTEVLLGEQTVNAGDLVICMQKQRLDYIRFTLGNKSYEITRQGQELDYIDDIAQNRITIEGRNNIRDSAKALIFNLEVPTDTVVLTHYNRIWIRADGADYYSHQPNVKMEMIQYGQRFEPVEFTLEGTLQRTGDSTLHPISGRVDMIRLGR